MTETVSSLRGSSSMVSSFGLEDYHISSLMTANVSSRDHALTLFPRLNNGFKIQMLPVSDARYLSNNIGSTVKNNLNNALGPSLLVKLVSLGLMI